MKRLNRIDFDKFWEAETTLQEEVELKKTDRFSDDEMAEEMYLKFISEEKQMPMQLEDQVWDAIARKREKQHISLVRWAVAASVAIVLGISSFFVIQQRNENREMQFALIEQTLDHVSDQLITTPGEVVYEDNYIVIVADN